MGGTPQVPAVAGQETWDAIAAAKQRYPGIAAESDDKVGEFLSEPRNFRSSFPEYQHLDDQTITSNIANARTSRSLTQQTHAAERAAGESQRATMPELPTPEPTGPVSRFVSGAASQAKTLVPSVPRTLSGLALQTAGLAYPGLTQTLSAAEEYKKAREQGQGVIPSAAAGVGAASGVDVQGVRERAQRGDVAGVVGETAAAVAPMVLAKPLSKATAAIAEHPVAQAVTKRVAESPVAAPLRSLGIVKPEATKAFTQGIQPGVNIPRAQESISIAGPDLQLVKQKGLVTDKEGNPITEFKSNGDLLHGVRAAKSYIWNALEDRTGSVAKLSTPTNEVGDAMRNSVSERTREQFPELAAKIEKRAATYDKTKTFRSIENAIQDANDDLGPMYNRGQANPNNASTSAEIRATEAEVKALRTLLDQKVEALTGEGTADLKRRYGALRDVERAAAKQYAVETRQKGATLWEGLAALRAAGDFVSGNMLGAAKGAATMAAGRRLALVRSPGWLIDQAFQGPKAFTASAEIPPPPGVKIAGELPPAPTPPIEGQYAGERPPTRNVVVTPAPSVNMPPNPELPAGPAAKGGLPSGPPEPRQLPPARSIQVGPSNLPPQTAGPPTAPAMKREVMAQTPATSRATPTGEARIFGGETGTLPAELHADLEKQAGRKLSNDEAIALDRANAERGMAGGKPDESSAIREEHRSKLEAKGRPEEKPTAPTIAKKTAPTKGKTDPVKELQDTKLQMRDLEKRINGTRDAYKMKPLIERFRKLQARTEELAQKGGGQPEGEKPGAVGAAEQQAAPLKRPKEEWEKPTPRTVSLSTYNSLTAEEKSVVDAQLAELPHMPQALREGRMRQLEQFGGKGTFLKERLARETIKDMRRTREPGED